MKPNPARDRIRAQRAAERALPARQRIANTLHATMTHADIEALITEVERNAAAEARARALEEAAEAARGEFLTDNTGTPEDEAYNRGVQDAIDAIHALTRTPVSLVLGAAAVSARTGSSRSTWLCPVAPRRSR